MTVTSTRLPAIDALRGLALFGILVVNMAVFHSGIAGMNLGGGLGATGWRNSATDAVITWLFTGKFILIFSFVFGWGVYTQATRSDGFRARYLRRLLGLILLGAVHVAFFFAGDILVTYALLGLFMLRPIRRDWPVRRLVRNAAALLAVQAAILLGLVAVTAAAPSEDASFMEYARRSAEVYRTGDFWKVVVPQRLTDFAIGLVLSLAIVGSGLLAMFRLGLAAAKTFAQGGAVAAPPPGQTHALARADRWPRRQRRLCSPHRGFPGAVGVERGTAAVRALRADPRAGLRRGRGPDPHHPSRQPPHFRARTGRPHVALRLHRPVRCHEPAVPRLRAGALQGHRPGRRRLVCIAVYAALVGMSHLWLAAFRIGPLEWLLRSITEWRWVALRPAPQADAAPA